MNDNYIRFKCSNYKSSSGLFRISVIRNTLESLDTSHFCPLLTLSSNTHRRYRLSIKKIRFWKNYFGKIRRVRIIYRFASMEQPTTPVRRHILYLHHLHVLCISTFDRFFFSTKLCEESISIILMILNEKF
jgi:hypothetical protein